MSAANDELSLDTRGFGWLYVVARREAYRLRKRSHRGPASSTPTDLTLPSPEDPADIALRRSEHHLRLGALGQLQARTDAAARRWLPGLL